MSLRLPKILVIVVAVILVGTYAMYSLDYKGNYNVSVQVEMTVDQYGVISLSDFSNECEPTEVFDWWGLAKGHSGAGLSGYIIYWILNQSGDSTTFISSAMVEDGTSKVLTTWMSNLEPGTATITIDVYDVFRTLQHSRSWGLVVG